MIQYVEINSIADKLTEELKNQNDKINSLDKQLDKFESRIYTLELKEKSLQDQIDNLNKKIHQFYILYGVSVSAILIALIIILTFLT